MIKKPIYLIGTFTCKKSHNVTFVVQEDRKAAFSELLQQVKSNRRKEISNDDGPLRAVTVCCDDGPFLWHLALWTKRLDKRGLDNHDFVGVMLCCNSEVCNATPGMKFQSIHIEYFMCKHWCFKNVFEESNTSFEIHKVLTLVP